jgi:hypothetical protein
MGGLSENRSTVGDLSVDAEATEDHDFDKVEGERINDSRDK